MGNTTVSLRWDSTSDDHYYAACARCEIKVTVATESERSRIIRVLRYDKHPDGARGRALVQEIPEMNLAIGDRVEPWGVAFGGGCIGGCGLARSCGVLAPREREYQPTSLRSSERARTGHDPPRGQSQSMRYTAFTWE